MKRTELVRYLNDYLKVDEIEDVANNGLQVEGAPEVQRIALAVDVCQATIDTACTERAQMLIVHHGLFWGKPLPVVGPHRARLKRLLEADCSLYAVHVPLDAHPEVGNNVQLARRLGLEVVGDFGSMGVEARPKTEMSLEELTQRIRTSLSAEPQVQAGGPQTVRRVAIVSGRAVGEIATAAQAGYDTFVTGEPLHDAYHYPAEYGINVIFAGHYATEVVGLQALAAHLEQRFGLETVFIDVPTGR